MSFALGIPGPLEQWGAPLHGAQEPVAKMHVRTSSRYVKLVEVCSASISFCVGLLTIRGFAMLCVRCSTCCGAPAGARVLFRRVK